MLSNASTDKYYYIDTLLDLPKILRIYSYIFLSILSIGGWLLFNTKALETDEIESFDKIEYDDDEAALMHNKD